jgi:MoxR-like ATPase
LTAPKNEIYSIGKNKDHNYKERIIKMTEITLTGIVRGKSKLYIALDDVSAKEIGKSEFRSVVANRMLTDQSFQPGDYVSLRVDLTDGGFLKLREVSAISNDTGKNLDNSKPETDLTVNSMFKVPNGVMYIPENRPDLYLTAETRLILNTIATMLKNGNQRINVRLTGPQGTGKTSLAEKFAEKMGYNFVSFDCGGVAEPEDWLCRKTLKTDNHGNQVIEVYPTAFTYGITTDNTVVLLDEFNRVDSRVHNAIYSLLDERGEKYSDDLNQKLVRGHNVVVFATMNQELSNVGTFELDSAIRDRFPFEIELDLLAEPILVIMLTERFGLADRYAETLAQIAHRIEDINGTKLSHGLGHRPLIACAKMLLAGLDWQTATMATIVRHFSKENGVQSDRAMVASIVNGFGVIQP